ncbi:MAG: hypothetical protein PHH28_09840 [Desulfuromonadaceae bacterium]|nr:hypothetical protein [Desulfuromonadaceae bacterium]
MVSPYTSGPTITATPSSALKTDGVQLSSRTRVPDAVALRETLFSAKLQITLIFIKIIATAVLNVVMGIN